MESQVRAVIDELRPMIQSDGGDIELVAIDEAAGVVTVRLHGACVGCSLAAITLKAGVERTLRQKVPLVTRVELAEASL